MNRVLTTLSGNVKTVQVSCHFGILRSIKSPLVDVQLNTGSGVRRGYPKTVDDISKTSRSTYIQTSIKTTGLPCRLGNKRQNIGCIVRYNSRQWNKWLKYIVKLIVVSGLLCKHWVGVFKCLSDLGIECQWSKIASIVSVKMASWSWKSFPSANSRMELDRCVVCMGYLPWDKPNHIIRECFMT